MPSQKCEKMVQTDRERMIVAEYGTQTGDTPQQATSTTIVAKKLTVDGSILTTPSLTISIRRIKCVGGVEEHANKADAGEGVLRLCKPQSRKIEGR